MPTTACNRVVLPVRSPLRLWLCRPSTRRNAPAVIRPANFRIEPDGLGEVGDGLVVVPLVPVGHAPVAIRLGIFRVQPDGLGEVGDGLVVVALVPVGIAPAVIRLGILRVEPDGLGVVGNGLVVVALLRVGNAPAVIRQGQLSGRAGWPRCSRQWPCRSPPCSGRQRPGRHTPSASFGSRRMASV